MFGTIAIIKPMAGKEQELVTKLNEWWDTRRNDVRGAIASSLHRNGAELIMSVVFESEQTYRANASDPAQDKWYQEVRALLAEDPKWMDGEVLACKHV